MKTLVALRLRQEIFRGKLRPNQKIDQDALAAELGISKLPVREALITLESEGLVENLPRRGCYVAPLTPDDIRDHYHLIGLVSGLAARRAASMMTDDVILTLRGLLERMAGTDDPSEQERLNFTFHQVINHVSGGRRLRSALELFTKTMPTDFFRFATGWSEAARDAHEQILRALADRDPDGSERAVLDHMRAGAEIAVAHLTTVGFWTQSSTSIADAAAESSVQAEGGHLTAIAPEVSRG
jgi:DNA-binding GntR family transcriptional regulator